MNAPVIPAGAVNHVTLQTVAVSTTAPPMVHALLQTNASASVCTMGNVAIKESKAILTVLYLVKVFTMRLFLKTTPVEITC